MKKSDFLENMDCNDSITELKTLLYDVVPQSITSHTHAHTHSHAHTHVHGHTYTKAHTHVHPLDASACAGSIAFLRSTQHCCQATHTEQETQLISGRNSIR